MKVAPNAAVKTGEPTGPSGMWPRRATISIIVPAASKATPIHRGLVLTFFREGSCLAAFRSACVQSLCIPVPSAKI